MEKQIMEEKNVLYGPIENIYEYLILFENNEVIYNPTQDDFKSYFLTEKKLVFIVEDYKLADGYTGNGTIIVVGNKYIRNAKAINTDLIFETLEKKFGEIKDRRYFLEFSKSYLEKSYSCDTISSLFWKYKLVDFNKEEFEQSVVFQNSKLDTIFFFRKEQYKIVNFDEDKKELFSMFLSRLEKSFLKTGNKSLPYYYLCLQKLLRVA